MAKKTRRDDAPRELERAGALCLAFANTGAPSRDDRRRDSRVRPAALTYADLLAWARRTGLVDAAEAERLGRATAERPGPAAEVAARAAELRAAVLRIFTDLTLDEEPRAEDLATVNTHLRPRPVLRDAEGFCRAWGGDADALDRMLWPVAHSAAELLASGQYRKVRQCGTRGCFRLFVGTNRRRVWCDANTCGSRPKGKRYHAWIRRLESADQNLSPAELQEYVRRHKEAGQARDRPDERPEEP